MSEIKELKTTFKIKNKLVRLIVFDSDSKKIFFEKLIYKKLSIDTTSSSVVINYKINDESEENCTAIFSKKDCRVYVIPIGTKKFGIYRYLDRLKYELIGMEDGWFKPDKDLLSIYETLLKRYEKEI